MSSDMELSYAKLEECHDAYMDTIEISNQRRGERPKDLPSREKLVTAHEHYAQTLKYNYNSKIMVIGNYYPPSVTAYKDLEKIMIKDLALETNHRGCYLLLRFICSAVRTSAVTNIAEDEAGNAITFMLNLPDPEAIRPARSILKENSIVILKEPYFTLSIGGSYVTQVDHPTDIVWLPEDDGRVPLKWRSAGGKVRKSAEYWKKQGNDLMGKSNFFEAIEMYSRALRSDPTTKEQEVIRTNRALANLRVGAYDAAVSDSSFIVNPNFRSEKTLYRGSVALYRLERYAEALELLQILVDKCPKFAPAKIELNRTHERLKEQESGIYNFKAMYDAGETSPKMDNATFKVHVEVRHSEGRGRGVFITKPVKAGELLICEKAFSYCFDFDASAEKMAKLSSRPVSQFSAFVDVPGTTHCIGIQTSHIQDISNKLILNPSLKETYEKLSSGQYEGIKGAFVDGLPVVDTFLVARIMLNNCFSSPSTSMWAGLDKEANWRSTGMWILASYINHSCNPNSVRCFIGDMIIIRAARDLPAGTELMISYVPPVEAEPGAIHERLRRSWGFDCDCVVCLDDRETSPARKAKRRKLTQAFHSFTSETDETAADEAPNPDVNVEQQMANIKQKETILMQLEKTYRLPASEVPRALLWELYFSVAMEIVPGAGFDIITKRILATFESSGFVIQGAEASVIGTRIIVKKWGFPNPDATALWLTLRNVYKALGRHVLAEQAKAYAKITWLWLWVRMRLLIVSEM